MGCVLIPYQQGGLFRRRWSNQTHYQASVLIPYQQGGLFRPENVNLVFAAALS